LSTHHRHNGRQRVVITGLGAVSPLGLDVASTWQGLVDGHCGIVPITAFDASNLPARIAATVKGFDPTRYMDQREARRSLPFAHYALAAATEALAQSKIDLSKEDLARAGVVVGSALGGTSIIEEQRLILETQGVRHINPTMVPALLVNTPACALSIRFGLRGPVNGCEAACATGIVSIGEAARWLAWGEADVMLAGGTDSAMTALSLAAFGRLGALSTKNDNPEHACAPFDAQRDGTVVGEGAAVVVLETLTHAQQRGAPILAEVSGYALTADAHHLVAPDPTGDGAARAIRKALQDSGLAPGELDWVCAHGTGTLLNDASETRAIKLALGDLAYHVPVSSIKGAVGHMLGASGALSVVIAVQAMQNDLIPPTLNYANADPECDLDYVPRVARAARVNTVMANAFGFGGQDACLVLRKWDGRNHE
jgi:3-oxoacyl-[acyl-carrier-protein] synthase II